MGSASGTCPTKAARRQVGLAADGDPLGQGSLSVVGGHKPAEQEMCSHFTEENAEAHLRPHSGGRNWPGFRRGCSVLPTTTQHLLAPVVLMPLPAQHQSGPSLSQTFRVHTSTQTNVSKPKPHSLCLSTGPSSPSGSGQTLSRALPLHPPQPRGRSNRLPVHVSAHTPPSTY